MTIITYSENETIREGEKLGKTLCAGSVVALYGGLGTGKTTFTRGLAAGIGINASLSGSTSSMVKVYHGKIPLFHFDIYPLCSQDKLLDMGWEDYLCRGGVCVVEWSENAPGAFPPGTITVKLSNHGGNTRLIEITKQ